MKKGKVAKKAMKFTEHKSKAEEWVASYDGTAYGGDIIKAYRKKFAVDRMKAVEELQLLGVSLTKDQIDKEKVAVRAHREMQKAKKEKKRRLRERKMNWKLIRSRVMFLITLLDILPVAYLMVLHGKKWD